MEINVALQAQTIDEFCAAFRISRSFFYKLKKQNLAPEITYLGNKPLILKSIQRSVGAQARSRVCCCLKSGGAPSFPKGAAAAGGEHCECHTIHHPRRGKDNEETRICRLKLPLTSPR